MIVIIIIITTTAIIIMIVIMMIIIMKTFLASHQEHWEKLRNKWISDRFFRGTE